MTLRVEIKPELIHWAMERSGVDELMLFKRFPKLNQWINGDRSPTLKQVQDFAKATRTPVGYLFSNQIPDDEIPIPDYRTLSNRGLSNPSANLLDTIYICQQRQAWYKDYARSNGLPVNDYVGSVHLTSSVTTVAKTIRDTLGFDLEARKSMRTWEEALRTFIANAESIGILVMCSGIVLNNTRRKLSTEEFRGFALADKTAPLIFINNTDTKSAQMFTLAHEIAHIWLGKTALSSVNLDGNEQQKVERWCDAVAAELLVPMDVLQSELKQEAVKDTTLRLARRFKVSTLVVLRRLKDAGNLSQEDFYAYFSSEVERLRQYMNQSGGGSFYRSQPAKLSKRFASALIVSTLEGQTLYRDAMNMLGISKSSTFNELGHSLGLSG